MMKELTADMRRMAGLFIFIALLSLSGCIGSSSTGSSDSAEAVADNEPHADNDIAMTIRSIMDAMDVDQPLDTAEYNYRGILTDGSGRPLYTDIQGAPGQWSVEVLSPTRALIKNLYLGDLVPEELTQYLLASLEIPDSTMLTEESPARLPGSEIAVYDFGPGELIVETVNARTESGHHGPLVNILLLKKIKAPIPT